MKITIEEKQNEPKRVYPYLGKADNGLVVAFTGPKTGIVVICGKSPHDEEHYSELWAESTFTPIYPHPQPQSEPEPIPVEQRKYPYVGKDEFEQLILFTSPKTGMLIKKESDESTNPIGDSSNYWAESRFTIIPNISRVIIELD